ncbi:hypothetical protein BCR44DRAFT_1499064 [Catenaria anguillulae PL171]|uniref:Uncharacterized protein n=1 Tax=Catenaria anguillulae PL171 TaxID=765915 RepID=A0A1Y2HNN3_9FUNG|nr:hypothetical protein BCR44DRAFT_1499064 [Catenaria anguillulae PL171]
MGPAINSFAKGVAATAVDAPGSLTSANPNLPPVIPRYQVQMMAITTIIANFLLPLLDQVSFFLGWLQGLAFGPDSTPVRQGTGKDAVLITGTSTGIGNDAAIALAKQGIVVFAGSVRSAVSIVTATLAQRGGTQLVGIVNNAGVPMSGAMDSTTRKEIERVFNVNVNGAVEVTQAFLPLMRQHGRGGRIVLIGSIAGVATAPHNGVYSASKRAVEGLFEGLRLELAAEKIHVSIIRPGGISTPIWTNHVTRAIHHALTARFPCHYYAVGLDARAIQWVVQRVPARLYDLVLRKVMLKGE